MSVSFSPIGPWPLVVVGALAVVVLTVWAYEQRLRGTQGRWRWVALGLRLAAVVLCVLAAFRPSLIRQEKKKQPATLLFLIDSSASMQLNDEAGQTRWGRALATLADARKAAESFGPDLDVKYYRFDAGLRDQRPEDATPPEGRETALGAALLDAVRRQSGTRVAHVIVLSDGANNSGLAPLDEARRLRGQEIPVDTVAFGSENNGAGSKDIALKALTTNPTVFVKNQMLVRGTLNARGFDNQTVEVAMYVDDEPQPVATKQVKIPPGTEVVPITGLRYIPQSAGERKVTLKVKPLEGELIKTNNEISTYVNVLKGGLSVLYLQGPNFTWEYRYLTQAIAASPDIQADSRVIRKPARGDVGELEDTDFAPGKYDVYILGDLPASHLTRLQQRLLTSAVEKGAGMIMLGGRSSFGAGGWADTEVARILPVSIHPGDGQIEPEGGLRFVPNASGLENYIFQVGKSRAESARIWSSLPPITGTNQFGPPKPSAIVLAESSGARPVPLMVGMETGRGRVLAFGDETWVWARLTEEGRLAHRKFWRQVIFWLAHKEDKGESQVKLALDRRRLAVGQKLELTVTARDAKNAPIADVKYTATVTREGAGAKAAPEPVDDLFNEGETARGSYFALGQPGEYRVTVEATARDGKSLGRDSARFLVYQDDRELENPAADRALLRQIAETTGGASVDAEDLAKYVKTLNGKIYTEYTTQTEHRIWDNWPFFLLFTAVLTLEWWLRKRHGWV